MVRIGADRLVNHRYRGSITGGMWTLTLRMVTVLSMLLCNMWVTKHLSPAEAGLFLTLYNGICFVGLLGQLGLRISVIRWVAEALAHDLPGRARAAIVTTVWLAHFGLIGFALLSTCLFAGLMYLGVEVPLTGLEPVLIAVWILTQGIQFTLPEIFRGQNRHAIAGFFGGVLYNTAMLLGFLGLALLSVELSLVITLVVANLAGLVNYFALMGSVWKYVSILPKTAYRLSISDALRQSLPILGTQVSASALLLLDTVLVGFLAGPEQAALYGIASRLALLIGLPLQICASVIAPSISNAFARNDVASIEDVSRWGATVAAVPSFLISFLYFFFGYRILYLFGPEYVAGFRILQVLVVGQLFFVVAGPTAILLTLCGQQKVILRLVSQIALLSIAAQLVAAHYFGALGVAVIVMLTFAAWGLTQSIAIRRLMGISCRIRLNVLANSPR